jgi:hypothetical protein
MSDFLYVIGKGAEFREDLDIELSKDIYSSFSGVYPHNLLVRMRNIVTETHGDISIEPFKRHRKVYADVLAYIADWVSQRAERLVVRLEGHRNKPFPNLERRSGTIDDVLRFRRRVRDPYLVEIEITWRAAARAETFPVREIA